jgi:hypothetical protein
MNSFPKKICKWSIKDIKRHLTSLANRKMQIKSTMQQGAPEITVLGKLRQEDPKF